MRRRDVLGLGLAAAAPWSEARAHPMPNSTVHVELLPGSVRLTLGIPMSELAAALGPGEPDTEAFMSEMRGYLGLHASILGADGRAWTLELQNVASAHGRHGENPIIVAVLDFTPPAGGSSLARTLRYDAVTHRVASHYVLVYRRVGEDLTPLGRLQTPVTELPLP